jgi:hypothetical protein
MPTYNIVTTETQTIATARVLEIVRATYPKIPGHAFLAGRYSAPTGTAEAALTGLSVKWSDADGSDHVVDFSREEMAELLKLDSFTLTSCTRVGPSQLATLTVKRTEGKLA